jgi:hypothetical protein
MTDQTQKTEPELIDSTTLAAMLSVSRKFIEKHRFSIAGGMKIGGCWRFRVQEIRARLATGRDIILTSKK